MPLALVKSDVEAVCIYSGEGSLKVREGEGAAASCIGGVKAADFGG